LNENEGEMKSLKAKEQVLAMIGCIKECHIEKKMVWTSVYKREQFSSHKLVLWIVLGGTTYFKSCNGWKQWSSLW